MYAHFLSIIGLLLLSTCFSFAQNLIRQERKILERELKDLERNPERFKALKEEDQQLTREINAKKLSLSQIFDQYSKEQGLLNQKEQALIELRDEVWRSGSKLTSTADKTQQEVVFRVQIGSYRNLRLANQLNNATNFFIEDSPQGTKRYMMGTFQSYWEAKYFAGQLIGNGAQAFVVGYLKGVRIENLKQMPENYF